MFKRANIKKKTQLVKSVSPGNIHNHKLFSKYLQRFINSLQRYERSSVEKRSLPFSINGQNNSNGPLFPFKIIEFIRPGKSTFLLCDLNIYKILWNYAKQFERSCTDKFCHYYIHKWKNLCMKRPNFRQIMKSKSHCIMPLLFISTHVICAFTHCVHNIFTVS